MEIFDTFRLSGRQFIRDDTLALTEILSDPEVMKYSIRGVCDEDATRHFIDWCLKCYRSHGFGPYALIEKSTNCLAGFCGVSPEIVNDVEEASLGYRLASKYWGGGLATEATKAVLKYSFEVITIPSVVVIIEPDNIASLRVTEKAGFTEYTRQPFHERAVRMYRMSRNEWIALSSASSVNDAGGQAAIIGSS